MAASNSNASFHPAREDAAPVSDELLGRLYRASKETITDLVAALPQRQRASLAVFCYTRNHLRDLGLAIAGTCDERALVEVAGAAGQVMLAQSRGRWFETEAGERRHEPARRKISLAGVAASAR